MNVADGLADLRYSARHAWARTGLWACASTGALMLIVLAVWWPVRHVQTELEDNIAAKRRELVQTQQAGELLAAYTQSLKDVAVLEKKLEYATTQAQLVENFSRLARKHGVKILSETYEEGRNTGVQPTLNAELAVQGGYPALREFLRDLSTLPTWSEVQEVRLESAQGTGMQKGRIRVVTYRRTSAEQAKSR